MFKTTRDRSKSDYAAASVFLGVAFFAGPFFVAAAFLGAPAFFGTTSFFPLLIRPDLVFVRISGFVSTTAGAFRSISTRKCKFFLGPCSRTGASVFVDFFARGFAVFALGLAAAVFFAAGAFLVAVLAFFAAGAFFVVVFLVAGFFSSLGSLGSLTSLVSFYGGISMRMNRQGSTRTFAAAGFGAAGFDSFFASFTGPEAPAESQHTSLRETRRV